MAGWLLPASSLHCVLFDCEYLGDMFVTPKSQLTVNGLHGVASWKIELKYRCIFIVLNSSFGVEGIGSTFIKNDTQELCERRPTLVSNWLNVQTIFSFKTYGVI
jgi:hypothetical protein